jgi:Asp-tRNA(Asn)/Glu-tRNA(Gln) amidotransferase B subunit
LKHYQQLNIVEELSPEIINNLVKVVLQENLEAVKKYQTGKTEVLAFLIVKV